LSVVGAFWNAFQAFPQHALNNKEDWILIKDYFKKRKKKTKAFLM